VYKACGSGQQRFNRITLAVLERLDHRREGFQVENIFFINPVGEDAVARELIKQQLGERGFASAGADPASMMSLCCTTVMIQVMIIVRPIVGARQAMLKVLNRMHSISSAASFVGAARLLAPR